MGEARHLEVTVPGSTRWKEASVVARARQLAAPLFTIALGPSVNRSLLERLAKNTSGEYLQAPDSSALKALFRKVSGAVGSVYTLVWESRFPSAAKVEATVAVRYQTAGGVLQAADRKEYRR